MIADRHTCYLFFEKGGAEIICFFYKYCVSLSDKSSPIVLTTIE